jgi:hypothetical protein
MIEAKPWGVGRRRIVTVLLLLHLTAIISAPMAGPPPASNLSRRVESLFLPYLRAGFLGHGYRFFAPNPGPSHLVRYEVTLPDGGIENHRFPDPQEQWPRLYYHRHFMVAEQVNQLVQMPATEEFAAEIQERQNLIEELEQSGNRDLAKRLREGLMIDRSAYERQRRMRDGLIEGLAKYFLRYHDGQSIRIYSVRHPIPASDEVATGYRLDDPNSYLELLVYDSSQEDASSAQISEEMP